MTTSHAAHAKYRASFGGWRAQRPFWGGLFLLLSGLELFLSSNLELALEVHFGPTGFLSYVLPAMMLLGGLLTWFSPGQRLFYGILGTLTALYSLIGLNLGGFFLGTVLGVVGGGLAVSWAPAEPSAPVDDDTVIDEPDPEPYYQDAQLDDILADEPRQPSGVLTDELPTAQYSPLHRGNEGGAGSADEQRPPDGSGDLPKRRGLGGLLLAVAVIAAVVGAAHQPGEAYAAPCTGPSVKTSTKPSGGAAPDTTASPSASPSPSPTKTEEERPGLLDWLGGLFGGGAKKAPETQAIPSESPAPPASGSAAPQPSGSKAPSKSPGCGPSSASPSPNNKKAEVAPGQPHVPTAPSILRADVMTMDGLTYDGVAELTKTDGSKVKVLAFSMKKSTSTPFELRTPGAPKLLLTKSSSLTVEGNVKFYTTRFSANVLGILPMTFTPSMPPPPIPLPGFYTKCDIELVYVSSNVLTAPALNIAYAG
ncbi:hypothetical protein GCM10010399_41250 [Dactylosporangium fulvum]|uniref:DUF6114 domain-containing protein n=1 Tax=Dactylosporangium fulvum TaxID=53359 RepID=A0ABY5VZP6_9ACTN|nr:DUF6114 domain-containing protein [Dactylosporangium fulvum]UWP82321.1 DUF6114 domain-containing protein [Dactylosporangium fulvum]